MSADFDAPGAPTPHHPIVAALLDRCGATPDEVLADEAWEMGMTRIWEAEGVRVSCSRSHISARLDTDVGEVVLYMNEEIVSLDPGPTLWITQIEFRSWLPPETLVSAMEGRMLDEIADVPGGRGIPVLRVDDTAGGLVLTLAPRALPV